METTYILLCMALAIGLLIGTLILNHQASDSNWYDEAQYDE